MTTALSYVDPVPSYQTGVTECKIKPKNRSESNTIYTQLTEFLLNLASRKLVILGTIEILHYIENVKLT